MAVATFWFNQRIGGHPIRPVLAVVGGESLYSAPRSEEIQQERKQEERAEKRERTTQGWALMNVTFGTLRSFTF